MLTQALTSSCCLSSRLNGTCICPLLLLLDHVICQAGVGGSLTHPFNPLHTGWLKIVYCFQTKGYAGSASGKETACQCRRHRFDPWARKIPPEEGMATHSSILAWRIPWTEEPGGLWSTGPSTHTLKLSLLLLEHLIYIPPTSWPYIIILRKKMAQTRDVKEKSQTSSSSCYFICSLTMLKE